MKKIIASRGMGKTQRLIDEAKQALREGKEVIFITCNKFMQDKLSVELPGVEFMTLDEASFKCRGRKFNNVKILIDDIDICVGSIFVGSILGTADFTYTLSLE